MNLQTNFDRLALVTGGSRGIGLSIAKKLASNGIKILLLARDENTLKNECEKIRKSGGSAEFYSVDFLDKNSIDEVKNFLIQNEMKPNILINGLGGGFGSISWDTPTKYQEVFRLNFFVSCELTNIVKEFAKSIKWGRFIYIGTMGVNHMSASAPYLASKSALMTYMKKIAKELAEMDQNLLAAAVIPGAINVPGKYLNSLVNKDHEKLADFFRNNSIGIKRLGEVDEVANVVNFLCQLENNYLHGTTIAVDGGASN